MEHFRAVLADRIKHARQEAQLTQSRAAQFLGVSVASLSSYEQASRDVPDAMIEGMARLYGLHPAILRYGADVLRIAATAELERRLRAAASDLNRMADAIADQAHDDAAAIAAADAPITPSVPAGAPRAAKRAAER
jgi:transcriptional regulator with XRE-family HTH domain